MKPITARQTQILEFIKVFIAQNGYSPSLRTIGKEIDLSPSVILTHLENMEDSGLIERMPNKARSIRVVDQLRLRPEVQWFAEQMELALRDNDHKGGWQGKDQSWLLGELHRSVGNMLGTRNNTRLRRAVNVANFAMMIADITRLQEGEK